MTDDIARLRTKLRDELDGAAFYARIASAVRDPVRKDLFLQLAQAETQHAERPGPSGTSWRSSMTPKGCKSQTRDSSPPSS